MKEIYVLVFLFDRRVFYRKCILNSFNGLIYILGNTIMLGTFESDLFIARFSHHQV